MGWFKVFNSEESHTCRVAYLRCIDDITITLLMYSPSKWSWEWFISFETLPFLTTNLFVLHTTNLLKEKDLNVSPSLHIDFSKLLFVLVFDVQDFRLNPASEKKWAFAENTLVFTPSIVSLVSLCGSFIFTPRFHWQRFYSTTSIKVKYCIPWYIYLVNNYIL